MQQFYISINRKVAALYDAKFTFHVCLLIRTSLSPLSIFVCYPGLSSVQMLTRSADPALPCCKPLIGCSSHGLMPPFWYSSVIGGQLSLRVLAVGLRYCAQLCPPTSNSLLLQPPGVCHVESTEVETAGTCHSCLGGNGGGGGGGQGQ